MPDDSNYETALKAALAVIHELTVRPRMARHEKLSTVTFIILRAMHRVEVQPPLRRYPEPSIN